MNYKITIVFPILLLVVSVAILVNSYATTGEWFLRSTELKGGTIITVNIDMQQDIAVLENALSDIGSVRELRGLGGYSIQISIPREANTTIVLDKLESIGIETSMSHIESIEPSLGETFWVQAQIGIVAAFILMGIIVFFIYKKFVPIMNVISAAFTDVIATLAIMQVLGMELSLASFAALLMLIGYSVDTDIMLASRLFKRGGELGKNVVDAFKTGMTMTGTTLGALVVLVIASTSPVITQIASVLLIGLVVDIITTWLQNSVLLRWYIEKKGGSI